MAIATHKKDPDAVLDYGFDWSDWLESGETLSAVAWTVDAGITKDSEALGSDTAKVWLSGGTAGEEYEVACKITTSEGREDERTMVILMTDR